MNEWMTSISPLTTLPSYHGHFFLYVVLPIYTSLLPCFAKRSSVSTHLVTSLLIWSPNLYADCRRGCSMLPPSVHCLHSKITRCCTSKKFWKENSVFTSPIHSMTCLPTNDHILYPEYYLITFPTTPNTTNALVSLQDPSSSSQSRGLHEAEKTSSGEDTEMNHPISFQVRICCPPTGGVISRQTTAINSSCRECPWLRSDSLHESPHVLTKKGRDMKMQSFGPNMKQLWFTLELPAGMAEA